MWPLHSIHSQPGAGGDFTLPLVGGNEDIGFHDNSATAMNSVHTTQDISLKHDTVSAGTAGIRSHIAASSMSASHRDFSCRYWASVILASWCKRLKAEPILGYAMLDRPNSLA